MASSLRSANWNAVITSTFVSAPRSPTSGQPSQKAGKTDDAPTKEWVTSGVSGAMTHFGGLVEARIEESEQKQEELRQLMRAEIVHEFQAGFLQRDAAIEELRKEMTKLSTRQQQPAGLGSDNNNSNATPHDQRTLAKMGCLGWNDDAATIERRARGCMTKATVDMSTVETINATKRKEGSQAEVLFNSATALQAAKHKVRQSRQAFTNDAERIAWLDVAKTRDELKPTRVIHRSTELLQDFLATKPAQEPPINLEKDIPGKRIKLNGNILAYTLRGELKFTQLAKSTFTRDELDMAIGYAEMQ
jgi:hypothetical protein